MGPTLVSTGRRARVMPRHSSLWVWGSVGVVALLCASQQYSLIWACDMLGSVRLVCAAGQMHLCRVAAGAGACDVRAGPSTGEPMRPGTCCMREAWSRQHRGLAPSGHELMDEMASFMDARFARRSRSRRGDGAVKTACGREPPAKYTTPSHDPLLRPGRTCISLTVLPPWWSARQFGIPTADRMMGVTYLVRPPGLKAPIKHAQPDASQGATPTRLPLPSGQICARHAHAATGVSRVQTHACTACCERGLAVSPSATEPGGRQSALASPPL